MTCRRRNPHANAESTALSMPVPVEVSSAMTVDEDAARLCLYNVYACTVNGVNSVYRYLDNFFVYNQNVS